MLLGNKLQDELQAKEEAKIQRKRELFESRRQRILNAKVRLIGLDVQALDQQVLEKQKLRQIEKDDNIFERAQAQEIERLLAIASEEERQMREFQMNQMKQSWEESIYKRKEIASQPPPVDFDHANCSTAAALKFSGEDNNRNQRIKKQKDQMRKWIQEQVAEKAQLAHLRKEEEMSYAEMLKAIDEIRAANEKEEQDLRKYILHSNRDYNKEMAEYQREKNRTYNRVMDDGNGVATSLDLFNEDKTIAMDEYGKIKRRDMFKGFTEEQRKKILTENQAVAQHKNDLKQQEKNAEYEWAIQQIMVLRAMEQAEHEDKMLREQQNNDRLDFLRYQIDEQKMNRDDWNKTKYGDINGGFFDGFGKSCR